MRPHAQYLICGLLRIVVKDAYELRGLPRETQATRIARFAEFPLRGRKWNVYKSRNLRYHPATYTLEVTL